MLKVPINNIEERERMEKCLKCNDRGEIWVLLNTPNKKIYKYCGFIEQICESAIDINDIKKCPKDIITKQYTNKVNQ